jgi:ATP-dependent RNA helicase DeaD
MKSADTRGKRRNDENMTRFFVNIGRKDRLNPARLIGLINEQNIANNIEIGQIEILDTFSFFELDKNYSKETITAFEENDVEFEGRSVNVEVTTKQRSGRGGGRRRDGGAKRDNRGGGGSGKRRKRRDGKEGGDFSGFGRKRSSGKSAFGSDKSAKRRKR